MKTFSPVNYQILTEKIFSLAKNDKNAFEKLALECFRVQYEYNPVYRNFANALRVNAKEIKNIFQIPFLPIEIFKSRKVVTEFFFDLKQKIFASSGTTQTGTSRHFVSDLRLYEKSFLKGFELFYGSPNEYCVLALLPSYAGREDSSLVYMAQKLIEQSGHQLSGFYSDVKKNPSAIEQLKKEKQKTLLLGVSYALLDLAELSVTLNENFIVMETGGMKGRREEILKSELHEILKRKFSIEKIHSEYGMTELLSQAYSKQSGIFETPPWMKVLIRDAGDPLQFISGERTGGISVIDLANINSCCFIATQDLGKKYSGGTFELMGRFDNSDVRGCNLLVT